MSGRLSKPDWRVALVGNPNTGKSTLFNALSGLRQRVGNYPGVTVEKKLGYFTIAQHRIELIDLPGTYSLAARSADEFVAVDVLADRSDAPVDAIICVVDANNLERNLFLFSQLIQFGKPLILALNMMDVARRNQIQIDVAGLSERLGVPVVPLEANKGEGITQLKAAIGTLDQLSAPSVPEIYDAGLAASLAQIEDRMVTLPPSSRRFFAERALLDQTDTFLRRLPDRDPELDACVAGVRKRLIENGVRLTAVESIHRYGWIERLLDGIVRRPAVPIASWSDRIDALLTHRLWGTLVFGAIILVVFQSVFAWAAPLMELVEAAQLSLQELVKSVVPDGVFQSLLVDGLIAGVGGVVIFIPQILILFLFIAMMEDCGYLARTAYLMDKLMSRIGLSGKSFIPLLSSFACAIPGIMATRIIENRRDRLITILVAPLMSCSARLPVYTLLISAFIPQRRIALGLLTLQGLTLFGLYLIGILTAAAVALCLRLTILRGQTPPFVMELPEYKWPSVRMVLWRMAERGWAFVRRAGTLIVSVSILIWAATYFPRLPSEVVAPAEAVARSTSDSTTSPEPGETADAIAQQSARRASEQMKQSYLGRVSRFVEPAVRPLGWDWKIAAAVIASFPAREVVVAALGVIYSLGDEIDENSQSLRERLRTVTWDRTDRPVFTLPTAFSLLVFFALCAQCASTLVIIRRETNSWIWPAFSFSYMTFLAYLAAWVTFQVGSLF